MIEEVAGSSVNRDIGDQPEFCPNPIRQINPHIFNAILQPGRRVFHNLTRTLHYSCLSQLNLNSTLFLSFTT